MVSVRSTGILVLAMLLLSLVWCGEGSCLSGHNDDDCLTLLCALANRAASTTPSSQFHAPQSCCAIGHTTAVPAQPDQSIILDATGLLVVTVSYMIATPPYRTLLRPPSA
jgi:hypothetical protein